MDIVFFLLLPVYFRRWFCCVTFFFFTSSIASLSISICKVCRFPNKFYIDNGSMKSTEQNLRKNWTERKRNDKCLFLSPSLPGQFERMKLVILIKYARSQWRIHKTQLYCLQYEHEARMLADDHHPLWSYKYSYFACTFRCQRECIRNFLVFHK